MAVKKKNPITVEFERERDTPNKQRFKEVGSNKVVGVLYVGKKHDKTLGEPNKIKVTIEPA